jgi:hypothetical protein
MLVCVPGIGLPKDQASYQKATMVTIITFSSRE